MTQRNKVTLMLAPAAMLLVFGCSRTDRAAADGTATGPAVADTQRDEYISRMEERASQLEKRVAEMKARTGSERAQQSRLESVEEDVRDLRSEIAELRNARADNWWPATERSLERDRQEIEQDMSRWGGSADRARTDAMTRSTPSGDTTHETTGFEAQRDRFVAKMKADLDALERELDNLGSSARAAGREGVDDVRSHIASLRDQVDELKDVKAGDWWDATKRRLDNTAERIERSIENLGDDRPAADRPNR